MRISTALVRMRSIFYFSISLLFIFLSPLAVSVSSASSLALDALTVEYDIAVHIDPVAQTIEGRNVITTKSTDELI
ncbi:MAG: M1 family peptidase, partial [Nitrosomonadaceae bacterium]|nr:M1 family peptidase [Nitrosomonadaceae bacterium]